MVLGASAHSFVVNRLSAGLAALAVIAVLLGVAHWLVVTKGGGGKDDGPPDPVAARRRGIKALVIGADGRASTSKLQVVLWTFAVFYAFVFLLVWGRSARCGDAEVRDGPRCQAATEARQAFVDTLNRPLQAEYYVLLGFPLAAAVAAKALTTNKIAAGSLAKSPIGDEHEGGVGQALSEVVSNDWGETDLMDFQFFAFNLLALAFFFVEFLARPGDGLPDLPPTLIALAGVATATYTTKKALEGDVRPAIVSVVPRRLALRAGSKLTLVGTGFGAQPTGADEGADLPCVLLDGIALEVTGWADRRVEATLNRKALTALDGGQAGAAEVVVMDADGIASDPATVELYAPS